MVKRYATHDYDSVLGMYYAKARFYDVENRKFTAIAPILDSSIYDITDYVKHPELLVQYLYVKNSLIIYIDPDGLRYVEDDMDLAGAYSKRQKESEAEKLFDYWYNRQEYRYMLLEGIAPTATTPELNFAQVRDYNNYIKKCDNKNNSISAEGTRNADLDFYNQHSPILEGMASGMYGGNLWNWVFGKAGLLPEGYDAIPYSGEHADLYKKGELLGNSISVIYGFSEFAVACLQKTPDKVPYVEGTGNYLQSGKGFSTFNDAKKALGSAGDGKAWHHIVEQNQIGNSGFSATNINNTKNLVSVESGFSGSIHSQVSGHYSSIQQYTNGQTVRQWLSGQSFQEQFEYGLQQLSKYGTMTPTDTGWIFTPFK
jgi:RHS repeat-associated protein